MLSRAGWDDLGAAHPAHHLHMCCQWRKAHITLVPALAHQCAEAACRWRACPAPLRRSPCGSFLRPQVLMIPANLSDVQLREALAPHGDTQLLHFASLDGAFGKWEKDEDRDMLQVSRGHSECAGPLLGACPHAAGL